MLDHLPDFSQRETGLHVPTATTNCDHLGGGRGRDQRDEGPVETPWIKGTSASGEWAQQHRRIQQPGKEPKHDHAPSLTAASSSAEPVSITCLPVSGSCPHRKAGSGTCPHASRCRGSFRACFLRAMTGSLSSGIGQFVGQQPSEDHLKSSVIPGQTWWPGPRSNRRPSDFQT
jgi:hypothetical protein